MTKFQNLEVYIQYRNYPRDQHLIARVRQYSAGYASYGTNLLAHRDITDPNEAMSEAWKQLTDNVVSVTFTFEPLLKLRSVKWTDTNHALAEAIIDAHLQPRNEIERDVDVLYRNRNWGI